MGNDTSIMEEILHAIKTYDTIIIHRHIRPDGDCIGAQIGLKYFIKENFPEKQVFVVGEEDESLAFIGRMDEIPNSFYQGALVMIVDTANHERISDRRYILADKRISIDHHPQTEQIGEIEWVDPSYTSTCEMIIDFIHHFPHLTLSRRGRNALFCGIVTDTNRFLNPKVTGKTFQRAGKILNESVDLSSLYQHLYNEPLELFRFRGYMMNHLITPGNGLAYFVVDRHMVNKHQLNGQMTSALANALQHIDGISIWFIAMEDPETRQVRVSLRSNRYPINHIASQFGGGGHPYASGVMLNDVGLIPLLVHAISDYLREIEERED